MQISVPQPQPDTEENTAYRSYLSAVAVKQIITYQKGHRKAIQHLDYDSEKFMSGNKPMYKNPENISNKSCRKSAKRHNCHDRHLT